MNFWPCDPIWAQVQIRSVNFVEGFKLIDKHESLDHAMQSAGQVAFWKFWKNDTFDLWPLKVRSHNKVIIDFLKASIIVLRWQNKILY